MSIGHNGQLAAELEQILGDGDKVVFHYAQWHINDYLEGTKTMSLEYEGAFMRFLMHLYQNGKPFADNDAIIAKLLRLSTRVWRRLKEALIAMGNIVARNGCLTNPRFEEERQKRAQDARKRAAAAHARWQNSRETSAKVGESFPEVSPKFSPNSAKKVNEINETAMQMDMLTNNQNPITNNQDSSSLRSEPTIETAQDIVWGKGLDWLREHGFVGNEAKLRARVGGWVKDYGPEAVLTAMRSAQKSKPGSVMTWMEKLLRENDRADQHVKRQGGRLEVFNGFQAELSKILDGRDLRRSLDRIGGKIPVHVTGVELESRVRALAIELVDQSHDQDRRYAKAAAERSKKPEDNWL